MSLQVVLAIEGQGTHIASERAWRGSRILHGRADWRLWHILCLGLAIRHLGRLRSVGFRGVVVVAIVKVGVCHDRRHRLTGGV